MISATDETPPGEHPNLPGSGQNVKSLKVLNQSAAALQGDPVAVTGTGGRSGTQVTIWDLAAALTADHMEKHGRVLDPTDEADRATIITNMAAEFAEQNQQEDSGKEWYTEDISAAMRVTELILPELVDSPENRDLFLTLAAINSPNTDPLQNWDKAIDAMQQYLKTGVIPDRKQNGTQYGLATTSM